MSDQLPGTTQQRERSATAASDGAVEYGGLSAGLAGAEWTARARLRLFLVLLISLLLIPFHAVWMRVVPYFWWPLAGRWHRWAGWALGVRVVEHGERISTTRKSPAVFVSNHISWLDILVLGGKLPYASFVAKSDIQGWGMIAWLCTLHRTIFVNRERRSDSAAQAATMTERVRDGSSLILFPEGTSTLGTSLEPFKSSLFSVAQMANAAFDAPIRVQPITISYTRINNQPLTRAQRPLVGWVGDLELLDHVLGIMNTGRLTASITYHPPITLEQAGGRKPMAAYCERAVRDGLASLHRSDHRYGPQAGGDR